MSLRFEALIIENFKSFLGQHEFRLDRAPGLYFIAGKNKLYPELESNGVGKTSLWDAFQWVLFGSTGRDNRPAAAIVPWSLEKGTCKVSLIFTIHKKTYELTRTRRPNTLTLGYVDEEPKTIEQYQIEKKLGLSEQMFRRTIVLAQFGTFFLDLRPEQQSQMFSEALNLDVWLKASKTASSAHKKFTLELSVLQTKAAQQEGRLQELRASRSREEKAELAYNDKHRTELKELDKRIEIKDTQLVTLLAGYSRPTEGLAAGLGPRAGKGVAAKGLKDAGGSPAAAGLRGGALARGLLVDIAAGEGKLRLTGRERSTLSGELLGLDRALQTSKENVRLYEKAIVKDKTCPDCGQSVSVSHLRSKIAVEKQTVEKLTKERAGILAQLNGFNEKIEELETLLKTARLLSDKLKNLQMELEVLQSQRATFESQENPHSETILSIKKRIKNLKAIQQEENMEIAFCEKQIGICTYWIDAFKEIRLNLIDNVLSELEVAVTQHADSLGLVDWHIEFQTERVKTSGEVSTAFNILLYPPGQKEAIKFESYSGGESQRWQLATAFGLSEIILSRMGITPNIEVLDEPTKGLSSKGIEDLLEHLADRAKELGRAIYVTEHHSLERGLFDQVITIQLNQKGSSIHE